MALGAELPAVDASVGAASLDTLVPVDAASEVDGEETDAAVACELPGAEVVLCELLEVNRYTRPAPPKTKTPRINMRICQLTMESLRAVAFG